MIEVILGVLLLAAGGFLQTGAADHVPLATLVLPFRSLAVSLLCGAGLVLLMHGSYRRLRDSGRRDRHLVRSSGLAIVTLALAAAAVLLPAVIVSTLNFMKAGGFPVGYYMAAQGSLIVLVILAFVHARRQDTLDLEEGAAEDQGSGWSVVDR